MNIMRALVLAGLMGSLSGGAYAAHADDRKDKRDQKHAKKSYSSRMSDEEKRKYIKDYLSELRVVNLRELQQIIRQICSYLLDPDWRRVDSECRGFLKTCSQSPQEKRFDMIIDFLCKITRELEHKYLLLLGVKSFKEFRKSKDGKTDKAKNPAGSVVSS
jgi:hypothetical protein